MSSLHVRSKVCMALFHMRSKVCNAPIYVPSKFAHFPPLRSAHGREPCRPRSAHGAETLFQGPKTAKISIFAKKKSSSKTLLFKEFVWHKWSLLKNFFLREGAFNNDPCPPNIHKWESERTFICQGNMCLRGSTSLKTSRFANEQTRLLAAGDSRARKVPQWFSGNEQGASSRTPTWLHPNLMLMPLEIGIVPEIALLLAQQINWFNLQTQKCMDFFKVSLDKVQIHTIEMFEI